MRTLFLTLAVALLAAAPAAGATRNVKVDDDYFVRAGDPPTVKVYKGTTVQWNWVGSRQHNIATISGPGNISIGARRSGNATRKMTKVGKYVLECSIHAPDMRMTLRVRRRS
jgi:plastocyanin